MTAPSRSVKDILQEQFKLTAELSQLTGQYHRLLQKQGAAAFSRQMAEDSPGPELAAAEAAEAQARAEAEACDAVLRNLESQLSALGHELAALPKLETPKAHSPKEGR